MIREERRKVDACRRRQRTAAIGETHSKPPIKPVRNKTRDRRSALCSPRHRGHSSQQLCRSCAAAHSRPLDSEQKLELAASPGPTGRNRAHELPLKRPTSLGGSEANRIALIRPGGTPHATRRRITARPRAPNPTWHAPIPKWPPRYSPPQASRFSRTRKLGTGASRPATGASRGFPACDGWRQLHRGGLLMLDGVHKHLQRARARRVLRAAGARGACERIDLSTYTPCVCACAYTCTVHTVYIEQPRIEKSRVRRVGSETRVRIAASSSVRRERPGYP